MKYFTGLSRFFKLTENIDDFKNLIFYRDFKKKFEKLFLE